MRCNEIEAQREEYLWPFVYDEVTVKFRARSILFAVFYE